MNDFRWSGYPWGRGDRAWLGSGLGLVWVWISFRKPRGLARGYVGDNSGLGFGLGLAWVCSGTPRGLLRVWSTGDVRGRNCDTAAVDSKRPHVLLPFAHDKTTLEFDQEFLDYINSLQEPYTVMGDAVYRGVSEKLITPYIGRNLPVVQFEYNLEFSRKRQVIERTIGATQIKWRISQLKENRIAVKKGPEFAVDCVFAIAVLQNRFTNHI